MNTHVRPHGGGPQARGGSWGRRTAAAALLAFAILSLAGAPGGSLPPVVFVSRRPVPEEPRAIPGLGPRHRAAVTGGELLLRERDGSVRALLPAGRFLDVADPAVSPDGKRIAFSALEDRDAGFRIWQVRRDGSGLAAVTAEPGPTPRDDLDPCWVADDWICFASTREAWLAEAGQVPVTNLWLTRTDGSEVRRLTAERNGAEEPAYDPRTGRIVYARWWLNRFRASDDPPGITTSAERSRSPERVDLWQLVELDPVTDQIRLAAGTIRTRSGTMGYQPAVLADGSVAAVYASRWDLLPDPGRLGIRVFPHRYGEPRRLAGAVLSGTPGDSYASAEGLAAPAAASPAGLPDGRIVFAYDPGARGDFGLYVADRAGAIPTPLVDRPGTLELDPAPLVPWPRSARPFRARPAPSSRTFTYSCASVFTQGPLDGAIPGAPVITRGTRLRFFAVRPVAGAALDTAVLIREQAVAPNGAVVAEGLPAHEPLFEQLVDRRGTPLTTEAGPAHVAGFNWGAPGGVVRCAGCHLGHSTLGALDPETAAGWTNAAPSARVTASSESAASAGAMALVDRRTRGPEREVAWIASPGAAWIELLWPDPIEARKITLYGLEVRGSALRLPACTVRLFLGNRAIEVFRLGGRASPVARIEFRAAPLDRIRIEFPASASARDRAAALAEVVVLGRPASIP